MTLAVFLLELNKARLSLFGIGKREKTDTTKNKSTPSFRFHQSKLREHKFLKQCIGIPFYQLHFLCKPEPLVYSTHINKAPDNVTGICPSESLDISSKLMHLVSLCGKRE